MGGMCSWNKRSYIIDATGHLTYSSGGKLKGGLYLGNTISIKKVDVNAVQITTQKDNDTKTEKIKTDVDGKQFFTHLMSLYTILGDGANSETGKSAQLAKEQLGRLMPSFEYMIPSKRK